MVPGGRDQRNQFYHPAWIARSACTTDGQRLGTMECRNRVACYERRRAQDIAAPELTRSAVLRGAGALSAAICHAARAVSRE